MGPLVISLTDSLEDAATLPDDERKARAAEALGACSFLLSCVDEQTPGFREEWREGFEQAASVIAGRAFYLVNLSIASPLEVEDLKTQIRTQFPIAAAAAAAARKDPLS
jgi:hypothetical protein